MAERTFNDLHGFIAYLEMQGELKRIRAEVDPNLEITEIATRVVKEKGPALLFERVKGSQFPLAINLFGSERRIEMALGRHPAEIGEMLAGLGESLNPPTPSGRSALPFGSCSTSAQLATSARPPANSSPRSPIWTGCPFSSAGPMTVGASSPIPW